MVDAYLDCTAIAAEHVRNALAVDHALDRSAMTAEMELDRTALAVELASVRTGSVVETEPGLAVAGTASCFQHLHSFVLGTGTLRGEG